MPRHLPIFNPFYGSIKADELSQVEINKLFVEEVSPIWGDVQEPVNQLIRGPRGVGKTILLKRVRGLGVRHLGLYVQISRISNTLRHVFDRAEKTQDPAGYRFVQSCFADYLVMEIVHELLDQLPPVIAAKIKKNETLAARIIDSAFEAKDTDISVQLRDRQGDIERELENWMIEKQCGWRPRYQVTASLTRIAEVVLVLLAEHNLPARDIFLLLDESAPIPEGCQEVINLLLQRGRIFRVKLATRPYEWTTLATSDGGRLEAGTDFRWLEIEYPDEMSIEYVGKARQIVDRILKTQVVDNDRSLEGWPRLKELDIDEVFPGESRREARTYFGFRDICALSSSNPQNLVSICSAIFAAARREGALEMEGAPSVPKLMQHQAMVAWSKQHEKEVPDPRIKGFIRGVLRELEARLNEAPTGIALRISNTKASLFDEETLEQKESDTLRGGFALGLLRARYGQTLPVDLVPRAFSLSRSLLPSRELPLRLSLEPELVINGEFVDTHARDEKGGRVVSERIDYADQDLRAFLSTSFAGFQKEDRKSIKDALDAVGISCKDIQDSGGEQFLYSTILREIKSNEILILNATETRPYTMFELGLAVGPRRPKRIVAIFNDGDDPSALSTIPEFLKCLEIISYSLSRKRLAAMASRVRETAEQILGRVSEFDRVAISKFRLRPRRARKTVYLSFPHDPIWERALPAVSEVVQARGYKVITESDSSIFGANQLQIPIFCASLGGLALIDTSGESRPDLLQCYKLGVARARNKWPVLRLERRNMSHPKAFSSVPLTYRQWDDCEELVEHVDEFIGEWERRGHA